MNALTRIGAIISKEVLQLMRDRMTIALIVGMPLMQLVLFGYAINTDVRHLRAAVLDQANTHLSRQFVADLGATQVIDLVHAADSEQALENALRTGEVSAAVLIAHDFDRRVIDGAGAAVHLLVDGSDPTLVGVIQQLTNTPVRFDTQPALAKQPLIEVRNYYNPERRSAVNVVPGLAGVILTMTMVLFTSVAIVRERERGNLELLIVTPVSTAGLMIGKLIPYVVIGFIQLTLVLLTSQILFDVPIVGDMRQIYLAAGVFILANLTLGLLISTVAKTQFQAMQMAFFVFLPSILLSGFMFPFDGMPRLAQQIAEILPLTHFLRLIRGIMLRGAQLHELMPEIYALAAFAGATLLMATLRFRKRLD